MWVYVGWVGFVAGCVEDSCFGLAGLGQVNHFHFSNVL